MRLYMRCLLSRGVTWVALVFLIVLAALHWFSIHAVFKLDPNVPSEVVEVVHIYFLFFELNIIAVIGAVAWTTREIYLRVYPRMVKHGSALCKGIAFQYQSHVHNHTGCTGMAYKLAERDLKTNRYHVPT